MESVPLKEQSSAAKSTDSLDPISKKPDHANQDSLNWKNSIYLVGIPLLAVISLFWVPFRKGTLWCGFCYAYLRGLAITAVILAVIGAGAGQDPIKKWCRDHRAHHRYVDTDHDPYSVKRGFFYAHIGWLLFEKPRSPHDASTIRHVDMTDLKSDRIVEWQRRYYFILAGYVVPTVICGLCFGDFFGGFFIAGCLATALQLQAVLCMNSVAHWFGDQPYGIGNLPEINI
ncbi:hypothetical protein N7495_005599 [Penicillium taxi]|uniref:uncharacterized protein n=1 Tax=Penicillium taxi TaxID=168475 RepID=UPI0025454BCB|nr:uncharacterized protein N7495_005599 [Penicillium taxi]KAJ5893908.1 hypothetical protein N7495_005599 [Penicillium taxi]